MNKIKDIWKYIKRRIFLYIIILQPILDIIAYFTQNGVISPIPFLIRLIILFGTTLYVFINTKERKKYTIFMAIIGLFSLGHVVAAYLHGYISIFSDLSYLIKVAQMPILAMNFIQYIKMNPSAYKQAKKGIIINVIIVIISLILAYITKTMEYTYSEAIGYTGWFFSANAQSLILIAIVPLFMYYVSRSKSDFVYFLGLISGTMLLAFNGTRTDFLAIFPILVFFIYSEIIKKNRKIVRIVLPIVLLIMIIAGKDYLPYYERNKIQQDVQQSWETTLSEKKSNVGTKVSEKKEDKKKIDIEDEYLEDVLNSYPYDQLVNDFGYDRVKDKIETNITSKSIMDNRKTKKFYAQIIYEEHNLLSHMFGFEFTQIGQYGMDLENDFTALFYYYGYVGIFLYMLFIIYFIIIAIKYVIKNPKAFFESELIILGLTLGLLLVGAELSGALLRRPNASFYVSLILMIIYYKIKIEKNNKEKKELDNSKITILALHLGTGGVENAITSLANMLCMKYNVEIISTYKIYDKPFFKLDDRVKVQYLIEDMKPNKEEIKLAIKEKNIINIIKQSFYAIKILYLRKKKMIQQIEKCDSKVVISTRAMHNKWLGKYGNENCIKIAQEHNHHNNKILYINKVKHSLKGFDYLITISKDLHEFYNNKLKRKKINVRYIPNCLDNYPNRVSELKDKNIISVGRLSKEKGYIDLINLYKNINSLYPEYKLNIVGDGAEYEILNEEIKKNNLQDNVILHGFKDKKELEELFLQSSIYVMTSLTESFALVIIEAGSYGVPVVAFDSAQGARELIENGKNGFLIENRNKEQMVEKVKLLIENDELRIKMGETGRKMAFEYTTDKISKLWYDLLDEKN
ncbi:MAG TPA: hypothetical protein DCZ30_05270 [Clostridiales bacterium]|nr:hypothetical protein [Clostridiales bacterium]